MKVLLILLCYSFAYTSDKREVAADHRDGAARRSGSAKDVTARKSAMLSSSTAKKVADYRVQGVGQRSSPAKAVTVYRRNWAGQKTQSAHLSYSTKKVGNYRRDGAAQRSGSAKDVATRKNAMLNSSTAKKVADYRVQGAGQRSSPAKAVTVYRRNWAGQKTQSAHLSYSTKNVGNYRRDGAAQRSGSAKDVATSKNAMLSSSTAKKIPDYRLQGAGQRSSPAKAVAVYRKNWAGQKAQSAHLSYSTKKVGNYRGDGATQRSGSAKNIATRKSAMLSSSTAKKVANYRIQGAGQRNSPAKVVAVYRRNWAGQKTQSAHLNYSTKKVGNYRRDGAAQRSVSVKNAGFKQKVSLQVDSKQKRDYRTPVTNVSVKPSTSFTPEKTQRRRFGRPLNSKATKRMLRRIMFKTTGRDGLPQQSKKPVRFRMPTRMGPSGNLEIVTPPTTPMPTFDPLKPIGRARPTFALIRDLCFNLMTQIMYTTQGQNMERVERLAAKYKHDTRYRIAFIILKLDHMCSQMTRKLTYMEKHLDFRGYTDFKVQWHYPFYRVMGFYTDMFRQNVDVTYGVDFLIRLYREKAMERQSVKEAKKERLKMQAHQAGNG